MKYLYAIFFTLGIILSGSDGLWFPWVNLAGLLILGIFGILAACAGLER